MYAVIGESPSDSGGCHVSDIEFRRTSLTASGPRGEPGTSATEKSRAQSEQHAVL